MNKEQKQQESTNLKPIIVNGLFLVIGALLGFFGTQANANAQVAAAQEAAKAQITSAAINVYGPIFTTQTAEAKLTPALTIAAPNKGDTLAIEDIPQNVFVFAGNNSPDGGSGLFSLVYDDKQAANYQMSYSLPEDKYGYAGMVFQFPKGYNLSAYKAIEFTIVFKDPGDQIDLFFKDIGNNNNSIRIASNTRDEMDLSYKFINFPNINFNAVKEIGVFASTEFMKGIREVRIKNVRFVK